MAYQWCPPWVHTTLSVSALSTVSASSQRVRCTSVQSLSVWSQRGSRASAPWWIERLTISNLARLLGMIYGLNVQWHSKTKPPWTGGVEVGAEEGVEAGGDGR
jgi:hypothetical protein